MADKPLKSCSKCCKSFKVCRPFWDVMHSRVKVVGTVMTFSVAKPINKNYLQIEQIFTYLAVE